MWKFGLSLVVVVLVMVWAWQVINWVWLRPRRIERFFRKQGMKGKPYKFLFGDSKETDRMYQQSYSKPIRIHDDILPRIMPNILDNIHGCTYLHPWSFW